LSKKLHTWTNESFTSLYSYGLDKEPVKRNITRIKGDVKSKFNESTAVVTKDGQTMYFTRNNILNNKRGYDQAKNTNLKIYRAFLDRKSTRLNSSHVKISYAVFCLKKKKKQ